MKTSIASLVLLVLATVIHADEPIVPKLAAFLIVCDSDPSQILVLDSTGKWLPDVKEAEVVVKLGRPAQLKCILWAGNIKPSKPAILSWDLAQIQSASLEEFQGMVDGLQSDPTFIKRVKETKKPIPPTPIDAKPTTAKP